MSPASNLSLDACVFIVFLKLLHACNFKYIGHPSMHICHHTHQLSWNHECCRSSSYHSTNKARKSSLYSISQSMKQAVHPTSSLATCRLQAIGPSILSHLFYDMPTLLFDVPPLLLQFISHPLPEIHHPSSPPTFLLRVLSNGGCWCLRLLAHWYHCPQRCVHGRSNSAF